MIFIDSMSISKEYVLGADPGKHGGLVLLSTRFNPLNIQKDDIIMIPSKAKNGKLDTSYLLEQLQPYINHIKLCMQEDVHALFGSSAAGTFEFGDANGALRTLLQLMGYLRKDAKPFEVLLVQPKAWQKKAWIPSCIVYKDETDKLGRKKKDTKATSLKAAELLFPGVSFVPPRCKNVHDGLIDAALIAYYALVCVKA